MSSLNFTRLLKRFYNIGPCFRSRCSHNILIKDHVAFEKVLIFECASVIITRVLIKHLQHTCRKYPVLVKQS